MHWILSWIKWTLRTSIACPQECLGWPDHIYIVCMINNPKLNIFSIIIFVIICMNKLYNFFANCDFQSLPLIRSTFLIWQNTKPSINLTGFFWGRINLTIRALLTEENSKRTMICHVFRVMVLFIYIKFLMTTWEELTTTQKKKMKTMKRTFVTRATINLLLYLFFIYCNLFILFFQQPSFFVI